MTKGYFIVLSGSKLSYAGFIPYDAYPSNFGRKLLAHIKHSTVGIVMEQLGEFKQAKSFKSLLKMINEAECEYGEYLYVYQVSKKVLKVYHVGNLCCTITCTPDQLSLYSTIFTNWPYLSVATAYNPRDCTLHPRSETCLMKYISNPNLTVKEVEQLLEKAKSFVYVSDCHYSTSKGDYMVMLMAISNPLYSFIVTKKQDGYSVQLDTQKGPITLAKTFTSQSQVFDYVQALAQKYGAKLLDKSVGIALILKDSTN